MTHQWEFCRKPQKAPMGPSKKILMIKWWGLPSNIGASCKIQIQFQIWSHPIVKLFNWSWNEKTIDKTLRWHSIYTSKESSKNAEICNNLHIIKCKRNKIFCSVWFRTLNYYCLPHKCKIKNHKQLRSKLLKRL